jgi:tryptophan synthase alpha chain
MSKLAQTFAELAARNERAFIPFVTCGDPDLQTSRALIEAYIEAGADVVEIGSPFTDPLADGPTIQRASERALAAGTTMNDALELIAQIKSTHPETPIVPMTYVNPVYQIGYENFARRCAEAGVDGVIISDLPPEAGSEWSEAAKKYGVGTIFLIAPTSDDERVEAVASATTGFIYAVARMGVTGAKSDVPPEIGDLISKVKSHTSTPVCAGFGFSSPDQIASTCRSSEVDGIVVASALIDRFESTPGAEKERIAAAAALARELKAATRL